MAPIPVVLFAAAAAAGGEPPVAFPHPLITEVLYSVPTGPLGDASADGKRDAAADEFIELVNPHERPINLRGYRLTDRNEPEKGQLKFIFPAIEVPPRGVVVVFNGLGAKWEGPVGDSKRAPETGNGAFHGAMVFTMKAGSSMVSWANGGDWALLSDPSGAAVQCVWWGKFNEPLPESGLVEQATLTSKGSIQRDPADFAWGVHADAEDLPFSPGRWGDWGTRPAEAAAPPPPPTAPTPPAPESGTTTGTAPAAEPAKEAGGAGPAEQGK